MMRSFAKFVFLGFLLLLASSRQTAHVSASVVGGLKNNATNLGRERISFNAGWLFSRFTKNPDGLMYDLRPDMPRGTNAQALKPWILSSGNDFIAISADRHEWPDGNPGGDVDFVQEAFNDSDWETVNLPHDWAIGGPFYTGPEGQNTVNGGMGRLPVHGVGWYRKKWTVTSADEERSVYLDIDGAMSYAMVWLNGHLVGGWPYGYNSFRLDLTRHLRRGVNQLAVRIDNPTDSSRWYPGAGLYRNVWLTKTNRVHVGYFGTYISSKDVSAKAATLDLVVNVESNANTSQDIRVLTDVFNLDPQTGETGEKVASFIPESFSIPAGGEKWVNSSTKVENPKLWGPAPSQEPNLYVAITRLLTGNQTVLDTYETRFGVRSVEYNPTRGLIVNGEPIRIRGVNQHHDLGALGAAFNSRAAQRQLEILHDMGCNAIRTSHNPPAPELLDLADGMGFLVLDEIFDSWEQKKTKSDFYHIFPDWHEPDLRSMIRRDRNHPSVVIWSVGNEVGEQGTQKGFTLGTKLARIVHEEDATRPVMASINSAKPGSSFPKAFDLIALNYQGEGVRYGPEYSQLVGGSRTPPLYQAFHDAFPDRMIFGSETASALSTRGTYLFPVTPATGAPVNDTYGGDSAALRVSAYELYSADFGSSADAVFAAQDAHPFVAGEFVWTGWDYLGEPTPYYRARSAYSGIVDLAGFPKDRFFLYRARWRPDLRTAHILPHWTWSGPGLHPGSGSANRTGLVTPVHVFSAADEAELFVNGASQGRRSRRSGTGSGGSGSSEKKEEEVTAYRFRWDKVVYAPGEVHVTTYKDGEPWAEASVRTAGRAVELRVTADRDVLSAERSAADAGSKRDLVFVRVEVVDEEGQIVPGADDTVTFTVSGPGMLVATDNGDPADMVAFGSAKRKAFSGLALAIMRAEEDAAPGGEIKVVAEGEGLSAGEITIRVV